MSTVTHGRNLALLFKILSPLIGFMVYVFFLVFISTEPFLTKWLNGIFMFFITLVLCNVIRSRLARTRDPDDGQGHTPG